MEVAPDFDEFIACLTAHGVEFVIVGAYALADRVQGPLGRHSVAFLSQSRGDWAGLVCVARASTCAV